MRWIMYNGFVGGGALYLSLTDVDRTGALYDRYEITDALLRENFAEDKDGIKKGEAVLYFISKKSKCKNVYGDSVSLPKPKSGDLVILGAMTGAESTYRVAEAAYFVGTGKIEYTRIKLV